MNDEPFSMRIERSDKSATFLSLARDLNRAIESHKLENVKFITTNDKFQQQATLFKHWQKIFIHACAHGDLSIVEFLVNFPDEKAKENITSRENIQSGIMLSLDDEKNDTLLYLKGNFPVHYHEIIEKNEPTQILVSLCESGHLNTIKLIFSELEDKSQLPFVLFLKKCIEFNQKDCFDFFLEKSDKKSLNESRKLEQLAQACLIFKRIEYLPPLFNNTELNLDVHLSRVTFVGLAQGHRFEVLHQIVTEFNYQPSPDILEEIQKYMVATNDTVLLHRELKTFLSVLEKNNLRLELENQFNKDKPRNSSRVKI